MSETPAPEADARMLQSLQQTLRLVCISLPHLAGLAHAVRLQVDRRVPTAAIFASGRLLANPDFFAGLDRSEATFVLAHELMHLALHTHDRAGDADPYLVNVAHDFIINDILAGELGGDIPAGGLALDGARHESLEGLVARLQGDPSRVPGQVWRPDSGSLVNTPQAGTSPPPGPTGLGRLLAEAMAKAGLTPPLEETPPEPGPRPPAPRQEIPGDVLGQEREREWFPGTDPEEIRRQTQKVRKLAARADSLGVWRARLDQLQQQSQQQGQDTGDAEGMITALRGCYVPPWDLALQRWLDAVAPGPRSFARPSRRGADRADVVLPGRKREGWTLHILLDTSGSMTDDIPRALGVIADYCEAVGVEQARLLQCDTEVTSDEMVTPAELAEYRIAGYGGSDMSPAMCFLEADPEVEALIVITDGYIDYPREPMPYAVLWVLPASSEPDRFQPPYGHVIRMEGAGGPGGR